MTEQVSQDGVVHVRYLPDHSVTCVRRDLGGETRAQYDRDVPAPLRHFLDACGAGDSPANYATLAFVDGEVIGAFRFNVYQGSLEPTETLYAAGTWVARSHRGQGVALHLWGVAMRRHPNVREVVVASASGGGRALTRSLARRYPTRCWFLDERELDENGDYRGR